MDPHYLASSLDDAMEMIRRHVCPDALGVRAYYVPRVVNDVVVTIVVEIIGPVWWWLMLDGMRGRVRRLSQRILNATRLPSFVKTRVEITTAWPWRRNVWTGWPWERGV